MQSQLDPNMNTTPLHRSIADRLLQLPESALAHGAMFDANYPLSLSYTKQKTARYAIELEFADGHCFEIQFGFDNCAIFEKLSAVTWYAAELGDPTAVGLIDSLSDGAIETWLASLPHRPNLIRIQRLNHAQKYSGWITDGLGFWFGVEPAFWGTFKHGIGANNERLSIQTCGISFCVTLEIARLRLHRTAMGSLSVGDALVLPLHCRKNRLQVLIGLEQNSARFIGYLDKEMIVIDRETTASADDINSEELPDEFDAAFDSDDDPLTTTDESSVSKNKFSHDNLIVQCTLPSALIKVSQLSDISPGYIFELDTGPEDTVIDVRIGTAHIGQAKLIMLGERLALQLIHLNGNGVR